MPDRPTKHAVSKSGGRFKDQRKGEKVVMVVRQFPFVLRWPLIKGLIIILIAMIPWAIATANSYSWAVWADRWLILGAVVLASYWLYAWIGWYYSVLIVTNFRLINITQHGFFFRNVVELEVNNIQNVNYRIKGLTASIFGFGQISVETLSSAGGMEIDFIHRPAHVQQTILSTLRRYNSST